MKKITMYVGLNDKDTKLQKFSKLDAMQKLQGRVANSFGGGTISEALGVFKHDDGTIVQEQSIRIETLDFGLDAGAVESFCELVKRELNQESILVETDEKDVVFA